MFGKNKLVSLGTLEQYEAMKAAKAEKDALRAAKWATIGAVAVTALKTTAAYASTGDVIVKAFDPIIALLQGASYPVAFIMITGGFLCIMMGQKHRGIDLIKWAGIGYIGMQLAPALMGILSDIGVEMRNAQ